MLGWQWVRRTAEQASAEEMGFEVVAVPAVDEANLAALYRAAKKRTGIMAPELEKYLRAFPDALDDDPYADADPEPADGDADGDGDGDGVSLDGPEGLEALEAIRALALGRISLDAVGNSSFSRAADGTLRISVAPDTFRSIRSAGAS